MKGDTPSGSRYRILTSGYHIKGASDSNDPWYHYNTAKALVFYFWIPISIFWLVWRGIFLGSINVLSGLYNLWVLPRTPKPELSNIPDPYLEAARLEVDILIQ